MAYYNIVNYDSCPKQMADFLRYIAVIKNLSPNTVNGYFVDLRTFFRYFKLSRGRASADADFGDITIEDISLDDIRSIRSSDILEYLHFVMNDRENNSNSRARKIASLRTFFKYLTLKVNLLTDDPVKNIDVPLIKKSVPKFLSLDESKLLLKSVAEGPFYERDYCILTLFLNCGMRLSELVGLNLKDVREDTAKITGKGNKERMVYLNDACLAAIDAWAKKRGEFAVPKEPDALFISRRGARLSPRWVEQIVTDCLARAGLDREGYSAHKLRHTAATLMYQYGEADMLALKEILGHEHVSTTEIYTHISGEQLKKAATSSPLADVRPNTGREKELSDDDVAEQQPE